MELFLCARTSWGESANVSSSVCPRKDSQSMFSGLVPGQICSRGWFTPFWPDRNSLTSLVPSSRCTMKTKRCCKMLGNGLMNDAWLGQTVDPAKTAQTRLNISGS
jgi:hypothetical protein